MKDKKAGMKDNPLFTKTEKAKTAVKEIDTQENISTSKQVNMQPRLQRRTFYLEDEVFEALRKFSFEKREKMYRVVNDALKSYLKNNP